MYPGIVNYLLFNKSAYTQQEMKVYKALEAYKQATCGWVRNAYARQYNNNVVVIGKVLHSQRLNERCLTPWIIANEDGVIQCGHCDCVAGLGEACTHVCALLFFLIYQ
ncbi:hypothetical protein RN001_012281 [Aquatica leii]|uniref:SWIM-type domain-containing protein n=1 Tax=Aquatica leii TaxID=1421715 RepID=A0AAN7P2T7_9COLE|nr:hypothetical protein RN001_012281 [Aquatica leii]